MPGWYSTYLHDKMGCDVCRGLLMGTRRQAGRRCNTKGRYIHSGEMVLSQRK